MGVAGFAVLFAAVATLTGCTHEQPGFIYMPDMVYSPALKAQEEGSMRVPPAGTIPRGFTPYKQTDPVVAGKELKNPLRATRTVLYRGQKVFNTYCLVCHGPYGEGDGPVAPKFGRPPSLQERPMTWPDGQIFHTITKGQNLMPSYATQIQPQDRWAIVHYIRALQRAKHPTPEDLKVAQAGGR